MKKNRRMGLAAAASCLVTAGCMQGNPVERPAGEEGRLSVAARIPIGSTEPVTKCSTLAQLRTLRTTGNYLLTKEIDASSTANAPFVPIGGSKTPFTGTFNGNNLAIKNLTIQGNGRNTGLFSWAVNADLKNIRLTDVKVSGGGSTGAIAGYARNVDLTYSYVTGTVTGTLQGETQVGMVFGLAGEFVRVSRCYATGTVNGWGKNMGGFIGRVFATGTHDPNDDFRASLYEVFTSVTVNPNMPASGSVHAGGLAGHVTGGDFQNVHAVGSVTGRLAAGGLLGYVDNTNPYSKATILRSAMSRGVVTDASVSGRTGTIGNSIGIFAWCSSLYDTDTDTGIPNPDMPEPACQTGKPSSVLKRAHPEPDRLISPFFHGDSITQAMIDEDPTDNVTQCYLGSGTDGDWGFGICGQTAIWALNSETEHITLVRIPNPGVQPKN